MRAWLFKRRERRVIERGAKKEEEELPRHKLMEKTFNDLANHKMNPDELKEALTILEVDKKKWLSKLTDEEAIFNEFIRLVKIKISLLDRLSHVNNEIGDLMHAMGGTEQNWYSGLISQGKAGEIDAGLRKEAKEIESQLKSVHAMVESLFLKLSEDFREDFALTFQATRYMHALHH